MGSKPTNKSPDANLAAKDAIEYNDACSVFEAGSRGGGHTDQHYKDKAGTCAANGSKYKKQ